MKNPRDLLKSADDLLAAGNGKPRQANLRRAVSTTYYALFHTLAKTCADTLVGCNASASPAWRQAYRALLHKFARTNCTKTDVIAKFPQEIQDFANMFAQMQSKRKWTNGAQRTASPDTGVYLAVEVLA